MLVLDAMDEKKTKMPLKVWKKTKQTIKLLFLNSFLECDKLYVDVNFMFIIHFVDWINLE